MCTVFIYFFVSNRASCSLAWLAVVSTGDSSSGNSGNYGWLSFEAYIDGTTNSTMNVTGWAFDDTGATIKAGSIGDPVPGPGGLAALALGAYGLRSRRRHFVTS